MLHPELIDPSDLPADSETLDLVFNDLMVFISTNGDRDIDQDLRDLYIQCEARYNYEFLTNPDITMLALTALGNNERIKELTEDFDYIESQGAEYWKEKGQSDKPSVNFKFEVFDRELLTRAGFPQEILGITMVSSDGSRNPSDDMNRRVVVGFQYADDRDRPTSIFPTIEHRLSFWDTKYWMTGENGNPTSYHRDYADKRLEFGDILDDPENPQEFFKRVKSFTEMREILQEHKIKIREVQWLQALMNQYPT